MNKFSFSRRELIIFLVVSVGYLLMPLMVMPEITAQNNFYLQPFFLRLLSESMLLLGFFLLNYFIFTSKLYFQKKYFFYLIVLVICFYMTYKLPEMLFKIERLPKADDIQQISVRKSPRTFMRWSSRVLMFSCMVLISLFLRQNKKYQEIKEEKQLSEIAYLRAQINPHFLFNTLNNIYALTLQKSDFASDAVMKLSKMMRFVVSESSKDLVPLQQDLEYIKNYIQLQQLRLVHKDSVEFIVDGPTNGFKISPLLLINFIENAFKYGVMDVVDTPIKIYITMVENQLELYVENEKENVQFDEKDKSEVGMKNTRKRLEYMYANRHELHINEEENLYIVNLKLTLDD